MGFFDFLKSKPKSIVSIEQKIFTLDNIKLLIDMAVCKEDAGKVKSFLDNKVAKHKGGHSESLAESTEFNSQELIDFLAGNSIFFYGYLDWKEHSREFDFYVRNALKRNFELDFTHERICDLEKSTFIDKVYKAYGEELDKYGVTLCNIDTGDDSYQIMLVRTDDYNKLFAPIEKLGYKVKHFTEEW